MKVQIQMNFVPGFVIIYAIAIGLLFTNSSCRAEDMAAADIVGQITNIIQASSEARKHGRLYTMNVEGLDADGRVDRVIITVTDETRVVHPNGDTAAHDLLKKGTEVKVWFKGPVSASYPVIAEAGVIRICDQ